MTLVNRVHGSYTLQIMDKLTGRVDDLLSMACTMYAGIGLVVNELNKLIQQKYSIMFRTTLVEGKRWTRIDVNTGRYSIRLNSQLSELLGFFR